MKKQFLLISLIFAFTTVFSQDLIVTNEGDSINCKISKVKNESIYFTFKLKSEIRNTLIPLKDVKFYQADFFSKSEIPDNNPLGLKDFPKFRLSINAGFSHQTAKISTSIEPAFKEYFKELKSGFHYGADVTYYFSEVIGVGFKYSNFNTKNTLNNIYVEDLSGFRRYGLLKDDITIVFLGPTLATRLLHKKQKNNLFLNSSIGYMGFANNATVVDQFTMTGNSVGIALDLGYDIGISENMALGFQIAYYSGFLTSYEIDNGSTKQRFELEAGEFISMHRLDFSVGLRFNK